MIVRLLTGCCKTVEYKKKKKHKSSVTEGRGNENRGGQGQQTVRIATAKGRM